MPDRAASSAHLTLSIVLYHSDLEILRSTIESVVIAVQQAKVVSLPGTAHLTLVDNSVDSHYGAAVRELLADIKPESGLLTSYRAETGNCGYGAGHNRVLLETESDYHLVLNPDVRLAPESLRVGLESLHRDDGLALLSPSVSAESGAREYLCKRYPSVLTLLLRAFAPASVRGWFSHKLNAYEMRDVCDAEVEADVPLASGCFMFLRTSSAQAVGGFNPAYFMYFEDFDLSLRLAAEGRVIYCPAMKIIHHGGYAATKGRRHIVMFMRSGLRFFNDHGWQWF